MYVDVFQDIRNQRRYRVRRKQELKKLETTLERLKTKATFYEEQMDYYNRYIETCLDNLAGKESMYVLGFLYVISGHLPFPRHNPSFCFKKFSFEEVKASLLSVNSMMPVSGMITLSH